jgi:hypothetical protein
MNMEEFRSGQSFARKEDSLLYLQGCLFQPASSLPSPVLKEIQLREEQVWII